MSEKGRVILLIDDEQGLLVGLTVVMQRAGFNVLTARDGTIGANIAKEKHPDLIVCDIMMPPPNGYELRKILLRDPKTANIPIIFLTARTGELDIIHGFEVGADDYLTKPFTRDELLARINAVLKRYEIGQTRGINQQKQLFDQLTKDISYNIGVEFRTPLAVVKNTLDLIKNGKFVDNPQEMLVFIKTAMENVERLNSMIEDMIIIAEIDFDYKSNPKQLIDIESDFKYPIQKCLGNYFEKNLTINLKIDPDIVIHAHKSGFQRTVMHLFDNACKFSPAGGEVDIKLLTSGVGGCVLIIRDEGVGIPIDLRERVFERYYKIPQNNSPSYFPGLGVGLTVARAYIRSIDGDVKITDSNRGCRIQMNIPSGPLNIPTIDPE